MTPNSTKKQPATAAVKTAEPTTAPGNLRMLLDVAVPVSVQLGQTRMTVRELLALKKGSLVQLTRMAGESMDFFIGIRIIAKGEITVVDDRLAIRISQLYGERERFKHL